MSDNEFISIGEAAEILDISIDTLRRWDKSGKLRSIKSQGGHRLYYKSQIEKYLDNLFLLAQDWAINQIEISPELYCSNSAFFQSRLHRMQDVMAQDKRILEIYPLLVAITGEIGNNSFDHNIGNWPDVPGIFFGYNVHKGRIVLADRGQGIYTTLKRVKPELEGHQDALRIAFTEILSGRAPESRGNGLKFVRQVVDDNPIGLIFQTGDAELDLIKNGNDLDIKTSNEFIRGCIALITF